MKFYIYTLLARRNRVASTGGCSTQLAHEINGRLTLLPAYRFPYVPKVKYRQTRLRQRHIL